jgi:hypothetical protein
MNALNVAAAFDTQTGHTGISAEAGNRFVDGHQREQVRDSFVRW